MAHTQNTTKWSFAQQIWHTLALLSLLLLAVLGQPVESQAGWVTCPPALPNLPAVVSRRRNSYACCSLQDRLRRAWRYGRQSWPQPVLRSLLLSILWLLGGGQWPALLLGWPWLLWLWQVVAVLWPELGHQPLWRAGTWLLWQGQRVVLVVALGLAWKEIRQGGSSFPVSGPPLLLGLGCQHCHREEPWVEVRHHKDGSYQATLCGHFTIRVAGDHPFRARMLMLFLRLLDAPVVPRRGPRTRDGRSPFIRQGQTAEWFGLPQPDVSRIENYWYRGAWATLFGQHAPEILTPELIRRVVTVCVTFPHWGQEKVYQHLEREGVAVTRRQVRQAIEQSGWSHLRPKLRQCFPWTKAGFHFREEWVVQELLRLVQHLQTCLETGQVLPEEEQVALSDLQLFVQEVGIEPPPPLKALPWLLQVEQVLFGQWQMVPDDTIRCPECQSTNIARKSRTPRHKKYYDAEGTLQEIPVYRYYCRNPDCPQQTFTHLPHGLLPYSRHRLDVRLKAVQAYSWSYSTYRRVSQALQVSPMTIYRWVSAWGYDLLPVAALFGLVRSSGIVGVDEKYVLVPKNDKPAGKKRRWMYVYLAVDIHTYDLLHIAIYPHNTSESAHAFLLALRVKGYHPRVVVTDLRRDYGAAIAQVFPQAQHHQCLFHAEQEIGQYLSDALGRDYTLHHPQAENLHQEIVKLFRVQTKRMAENRYQALRNRREEFVQAEPALAWIFDFLETHWPFLINSIENDLIPATNNATEMVIRRFDQHYQNFCGFESIETARVYLGVFEKIYRFTPFSEDAQPRVRGKSPLQLAGYDLSHMPMNWLCRGYCLEKAVTYDADLVPNL
jgi:transposase-like protein